MFFTDNERTLLIAFMMKNGLIPLTDAGLNVDEAFKQLSADDARVIKRKFRKFWRKIAHKEALRAREDGEKRTPDEYVRNKYGLKKQKPSRSDMTRRKLLVRDHFIKNLVRPTLDAFESDERKLSQKNR